MVDNIINLNPKRFIFMASVGIYNELEGDGAEFNVDNDQSQIPNQYAAELIESSDVVYTIIRAGYLEHGEENGTARMAINLEPGSYTIRTTFNGTTVENTITVLPTLIAENLVKYYKNASQFLISLIDGEGNPVSGVNITMNINGVFYNRTTDENGIALLNIRLMGGKYIITSEYNEMRITNTITIKGLTNNPFFFFY